LKRHSREFGDLEFRNEREKVQKRNEKGLRKERGFGKKSKMNGKSCVEKLR
jgi:hypothetical protein